MKFREIRILVPSNDPRAVVRMLTHQNTSAFIRKSYLFNPQPKGQCYSY